MPEHIAYSDLHFFSKGLSETELPRISEIEGALVALRAQVVRFQANLALFDHAGELYKKQDYPPPPERPSQEHLNLSKQYLEWRFTAARDGAMNLRDFEHCLNDLNTTIGTFPTIVANYDRSLRAAAVKCLKDNFPNLTDLRDATAHEAQGNKQSVRNRASLPITQLPTSFGFGGGGSVSISGSLFDRTYVFTYNNRNMTNPKLVSYELSEESLQTLIKVWTMALGCLMPAAQYTERQTRST